MSAQQVQEIRTINQVLAEAAAEGNLETVQKWISHPLAMVGNAAAIAAKAGQMEIVQLLIQQYGVEKRFVNHAMLELLQEPEIKIDIFEKIFASDLWLDSQDNVLGLFDIAIRRDNLEVFRILSARYTTYRSRSLVAAAKAFAVTIFSWLLKDVSIVIVHCEGIDLVTHLAYGFQSTYKLGYHTPRGNYCKHHNKDQIRDKNQPLYQTCLRQLRERLSVSDMLVERCQTNASALIKAKNQQLKEESAL